MVYSGEKTADGSPDDHNVAMGGSSKGEEPQVWEHPWTTNEIRKNSSTWTLAGDVGLLNHLKQFSHQLISRTHQMENVVDTLVHKSKVTCAKVNNVINDFQMLSNVQFVENRVYDEEAKDPDSPAAPETQTKSKEQREAEMVPRLKEALQIGISVMDKLFEKIDVDEMSDSEEEEELSQGRTILEPVDLYEHRPLPYVIGSEEFQKDDYAGLHHLCEEDISTDISTQDENVSASAESETEESEEEDDFEKESRKPTIISKHKETKSSIDTLQERLSDSGSSDLFDAQEEDEGEDGYVSGIVTEEKPKEEKLNFIDELKKKTQPAANDTPVSKPPVASSPIKETISTKDSDDLFTSNDSFFDEEDSPFRKKSGLFSSDALFGKIEEKNENGLFDDEIDQKAVPIKKKEVPSKRKLSKPEPVKEIDTGSRSSPGLFDDFDDSDLFSSIAVKSVITSKAKEPVISTKERSPSITSSSASSLKKTEKSPSIVEDAKSSNSLFGEDSDDNDLFSTPSKPKEKGFDFSSSNVNEDDDDDLFSTKPFTSSKKEPVRDIIGSTPKSSKNEKESLFEDSDSFDLFKPNVEEKKLLKSDLVKTVKPPAPKESTPKSAVKEKQPSLFEDSDNFDLFKPSVEKKAAPKSDSPLVSEKAKSKPVGKPSLFDDSDPFDLFGAPEQEKTKPKEKVFEKPPINKKEKSEKKVEPVLPTTSSPKVSSSKPLVNDETIDSALSFDQPISNNAMLGGINKDRVKIQTKRRKPTRKGRQSRISTDLESSKEGDSEVFQESLSKSEEIEKTTTPSKQPPSNDVFPSKPAAASHKESEKSKKNLMSQLISEAAAFKKGKRDSLLDEKKDELLFEGLSKEPLGSDFSFVSPTSSKKNIFDSSPKDKDLFEDSSSKKNLFEDSSESRGPKTSESGNILSDSTDDDDLFAAPAFSDFKSNISEKNSIFDDDDDNIFKPLKNKDTASKSSDSLMDVDDDDIFAGVDKEKYELAPKLPIDDDDDDDIFSNVSKPAKTTAAKSQSTTKKPSKESDMFDDPLGGLALND